MSYPMADAAEMLWVVLANVSDGDWSKQSHDWQQAAAEWRDNYFEVLDQHMWLQRHLLEAKMTLDDMTMEVEMDEETGELLPIYEPEDMDDLMRMIDNEGSDAIQA